jgi:phage-related minor tail protein
MDNALRQFVQTGKLNFKDLVKSMIQELIYLESKAKLMDIFKKIKGNGGGGGIMDMLGGLFGGGGGGMTGAQHNMLAASFNAPAADGGDLAANKIGLVGERGPELFIPRTAGTIIPNNALAGIGGGQTINYNGPYIASMNAIDTQSGTQFLAKNKNTIWAAYQSANRGVPVSR